MLVSVVADFVVLWHQVLLLLLSRHDVVDDYHDDCHHDYYYQCGVPCENDWNRRGRRRGE